PRYRLCPWPFSKTRRATLVGYPHQRGADRDNSTEWQVQVHKRKAAKRYETGTNWSKRSGIHDADCRFAGDSDSRQQDRHHCKAAQALCGECERKPGERDRENRRGDCANRLEGDRDQLGPLESECHRGSQVHHRDQSKGDERIGRATSELQSRGHLVCRLLLEKKKSRRRCFSWTRRRSSGAATCWRAKAC